jgi:hypothetical protein
MDYKGQGSAGDSHAKQPIQPPALPPYEFAVNNDIPPVPPSGYRVPLTTTSAFPDTQQTGHPPCNDADGVSPIFIGSALFPNSVHPCKIAPHLSPFARVPYGGAEYYHHGRYDLLPFDPKTMELVPTSYGRIPHGRYPIEGGYEENGAKLYHAIGRVNGVRVPGKTGVHLFVLPYYWFIHINCQPYSPRGACNVPFNGQEIVLSEDYEILLVSSFWRKTFN